MGYFSIRDSATGSNVSIKSTAYGSTFVSNSVSMVAVPDDRVFFSKYTNDLTSHILLAAAAGSPDIMRNYICALQIANEGGTASRVSIFNGVPGSPDVALVHFYVPAGNTHSAIFPIPLQSSHSTPFYFRANSLSSIFVSGQGFASADV